MADSHEIINGQVVPYSGGRQNLDTATWRDATAMELEQQNRIRQLEKALNDLIETAAECDSWESFPFTALEKAEAAL